MLSAYCLQLLLSGCSRYMTLARMRQLDRRSKAQIPQLLTEQLRQSNNNVLWAPVFTVHHVIPVWSVMLQWWLFDWPEALEMSQSEAVCVKRPQHARQGHTDRGAVFYSKAHLPSSSIHLSVMGCCLATLHIVLTSSHNSPKVKVAGRSVISMSLNAHRENVKIESLCWSATEIKETLLGSSTNLAATQGIFHFLLKNHIQAFWFG